MIDAMSSSAGVCSKLRYTVASVVRTRYPTIPIRATGTPTTVEYWLRFTRSQFNVSLKLQNELVEVAKCSYSETEETATPATANSAIAAIKFVLCEPTSGALRDSLMAACIRSCQRAPAGAAYPLRECRRKIAKLGSS